MIEFTIKIPKGLSIQDRLQKINADWMDKNTSIPRIKPQNSDFNRPIQGNKRNDANCVNILKNNPINGTKTWEYSGFK